MEYIEKYNQWCNNEIFNEKTKKELEQIKDNEEEIKDRFYKDLEFGTAGLRGVIGAGTNRMNIYTVGKATQGLANYIKQQNGEKRGVAIAYDSRNMSAEFSEQIALCLCANGIKAYLFESLRPVPELSFTVRQLGCIAGIVVTASHNPPKYNGYKVYWEDGAQITAPKDKEIIEEVNKITDFNQIKTISKEEAKQKNLLEEIGQKIDNLYIEEIKKLVLNPEIIKKQSKALKIVYTPLHGTGNIPVKRVLSELGFENVYIVEEQEKPDGNFPTVKYPNPEDKDAYKLAFNLAKKVDADIILATDPDADRVGIYAKDKTTGEYMHFTGNMSCLLLAQYIIEQKQEKGILPKNAALIKSIVSSNMAYKITEEYNIKLIEVLTGFKYIGEKIKEFEQTNEYQYIFGFEESYGCLIGTYARDKDGIAAVMALCEAAAYYKDKNLTLWDQMINMYEKYGYYKEDVLSITLEGAEGAEKIKSILEKLRKNPITTIAGYNTIQIKDFSTQEMLNLKTNEKEKINLPKSNVIYYQLEDDNWCCIRPSGTEPKIKIYIGVKGISLEDANQKTEKIKEEIKQKLI